MGKLLERGLMVAGLVAVVAGAVGLALRPAPVVHPTSSLGTPVVIISPQVLALEGLSSITVLSPGTLEVRTARPSDAYAWVLGIETSVVRGLDSWDELHVDERGTVSGEVPEFPGDLWRWWRMAFQEATIDVSDIETGLALIVVAGPGEPLEQITFTMTRDRGNGWAWPTGAAGLGLISIGLGVMLVRLVRTWFRTRGEVAS